MDAVWERMAAADTPSWYLHPLVAQQKREVHLAWIRRWQWQLRPGLVLKTDLFEDAFGDDTLLPALLADGQRIVGIDWLPPVVRRAAQRFRGAALLPLAADCRSLPLASASVAAVLSPSTLDHFPSPADFDQSIAELARVIEPGGLLLITLDNPHNPLYWALRLLSRAGWTPFPIGYTPAPSTLDRRLQAEGFEVLGREWLVHNPRLVTTALFVTLQKLLGRRADPLVAMLLSLFDMLGGLPTRSITACFVATCARARDTGNR
ncbi:MAG: class I SAM-dependent methyltransferase [Gemmatimonadaceae bacterium]|nr:class I SAM-dependent methyltransferase [Gemmatimonadaceae bacterium]